MSTKRPDLILVTPETYGALLQEAEWRHQTALSAADRLQMRWIQLQGRRIPGTRWTVLWRLCLAKYQVRRFRRWLHLHFVYRPQVAWAYHVVYRNEAPLPRTMKSSYWPCLRDMRPPAAIELVTRPTEVLGEKFFFPVSLATSRAYYLDDKGTPHFFPEDDDANE